MNISDLLDKQRIQRLSGIASKKKLLEEMGAVLASGSPHVSADEVFEQLINRERLGSTGLGHGVALPHARLPGQELAIGAFAILDQPIDFDAIDGQPVDLLFCLLVPDHFTDEHLDILAQLAKLFSDESFCKDLRETGSDEELFELLTSKTSTSAA